jgi:hypothetical protein
MNLGEGTWRLHFHPPPSAAESPPSMNEQIRILGFVYLTLLLEVWVSQVSMQNIILYELPS